MVPQMFALDQDDVSAVCAGAGRRGHAADVVAFLPARKLAATADILRQILAGIPDDLAGLRYRALLLVGFADALRPAELMAIRVVARRLQGRLPPCVRSESLNYLPRRCVAYGAGDGRRPCEAAR